MSGTISLSLSQQFDSSGDPLDGGLLSFFQAGTTTPQSAYQDTALTIAHPNPIVLDAAGRVPQFFLADGEIKIRLTSAEGVVQLAADNILVIGASSGSGGTSVDATKILDTGDIKHKYGTGVLAGFVRCNARTIGSATSGGTERANADCEDLFVFLWDADENLTVSTGRGANAAADWAANKTITLPDGRGRGLVGLADMGSSTSNILSGVTFNSPGTSTTLGSTAGLSTRTIAQGNLPAASLAVSGSITVTPTIGGGTALGVAAGSGLINGGASGTSTYGFAGFGQFDAVNAVKSLTAALGGSGTALETISPLLLVTTYIKL